MGHLYQRGTVWWIQFYQDGQRVRMTSESEDKDVAKRMLKEHEARVTLKEPVVAQASRVTYDMLRTDLVEHYQATESRNLEEAGWRLKHLDRAFRGARASLITAAAVTRYIVQRQGEKAANGTINREVAVLLRMLRLGLERGKVARVPIVHKPKEAAPRAGFFEADAFDAVRGHLPEDLRVAVTVALHVRVADAERSARPGDPAGRSGRGHHPAGPRQHQERRGAGSLSHAELSGLLAAHVDRVRTLSHDLKRVVPWLFPHFVKPHQGSQRRDFRKAWKTASKDAGFAGMLRHDFRRTAVRNMVNRSISERGAMTITGHKTRAVFDRYHIVSPADLRDAARKLGELASATIATTVGQVTPLRRKRSSGQSGG